MPIESIAESMNRMTFVVKNAHTFSVSLIMDLATNSEFVPKSITRAIAIRSVVKSAYFPKSSMERVLATAVKNKNPNMALNMLPRLTSEIFKRDFFSTG